MKFCKLRLFIKEICYVYNRDIHLLTPDLENIMSPSFLGFLKNLNKEIIKLIFKNHRLQKFLMVSQIKVLQKEENKHYWLKIN